MVKSEDMKALQKPQQLIFEPQLPMHEADTIRVVQRRGDLVLGDLVWHARQNCFVFEPLTGAQLTAGSMLDLAAQIAELTKLRAKTKRREKKSSLAALAPSAPAAPAVEGPKEPQ